MFWKIYIARQISGSTPVEVETYYRRISEDLGCHYRVLSPMVGKQPLRTEAVYRPHDYRHPVATNHAIAERDCWMVRQADVVYANFVGMTTVSIGMTAELAWAHLLGKHTVIALDGPAGQSANPHWHAFILEMADVIFSSHIEAIRYLRELAESAGPRRPDEATVPGVEAAWTALSSALFGEEESDET